MKSLTIEREYGTGGWELGKIIAEKEGIPFYDEAAIIANAERLGHKLALLKNYEEKKKESILYNIAMVANKETELKVEIEKMILELFKELKETIEYLHAREPAVFVGAGVCGLVSNTDDYVRVFLCSSRIEDKILHLQKGNAHYSIAELKNIIKKKDAQRSIYFRMLTQKEWDKTDNYDFVYDIAKVSRETMCKEICQRIKKL